jgi:thioredoxin reductase
MKDEHADVVIVGAGPAGLAAAAALKQLGTRRVVVLDREATPGGVPRHTHHTGYGLRDLHRVMAGPAYARHRTRLAQAAGAEIRLGATATGWLGPVSLAATSPEGLTAWHARAVLLATGCRERPRTARLVPGDRPAGVLTTGSLQQLADLGLPIGRRAVVVGAEHVSFSAVHTLASHGVQVAAVVTGQPRPQSYPLLQALTAGLRRVPVFSGTEIAEIEGRHRVERVMLRSRRGGESRAVGCDTVVFTGDWIPDHELARAGDLEMAAATQGPTVDQLLRTSRPGVFAAGNLTHPAETADIAALAGRHAAGAISGYLRDGRWPSSWVTVTCPGPLRWVWPPRLAPGEGTPPRGRLIARAAEFRGSGHVEVRQGGELLHREYKRRLVPNRSITIRPRRLPDAPDPIVVQWAG